MYTKNGHTCLVIRSFADKETQKIFNGYFSRKLPVGIQKVALRKLIMIDVAERLSDLKSPPSNHLEALCGDRIGQFSIRINAQRRICFIPSSNGSHYEKVEIVDYH